MSVPDEPLSARYFAKLYSPEPQRAALDALLGIEHEVLESLRPGIDHHVAHSRLQWWREECERTVADRPVHPLTRALAGALSPAVLSGLSGFVDVAVWDLASATFETRREVTAYCERWATAMIEPLAAADGAADTTLLDWRKLGTALREIELLGELAREAHRGRVRLPLEELDRAKVDPSSLAKPPWPDALAQILRDRYGALRDEIAGAAAKVDKRQQPTLRGVLVWAALSYRGTVRAESALPDQSTHGRLDAISDAWLAWRVARKATLGRFTLS